MPRFVVRPRARIDIDGIWDYIAQDSVPQADAFVDRMTAKFKRPKFRLLAYQPVRGRLRDDLMPNLRSFPCERYIIFCRSITDGIEIIRLANYQRLL
jgi:toxin ParE1/3/4